jgi:excisionase family DNA binding protein
MEGQSMETTREVMTPEQVAEYLQLDRETIYRYIRNGKLVASKLGRAYRIKKFDVDILLLATRSNSEFVPREYSREQMEQWFEEDKIDEATREAFKEAIRAL